MPFQGCENAVGPGHALGFVEVERVQFIWGRQGLGDLSLKQGGAGVCAREWMQQVPIWNVGPEHDRDALSVVSAVCSLQRFHPSFSRHFLFVRSGLGCVTLDGHGSVASLVTSLGHRSGPKQQITHKQCIRLSGIAVSLLIRKGHVLVPCSGKDDGLALIRTTTRIVKLQPTRTAHHAIATSWEQAILLADNSCQTAQAPEQATR